MKYVSDSMGLSWHSEKLNVLLFHSDRQEEAFYTTTTTPPCRTMMGAPETGTLKPLKPTPIQHTLFPQGFHQQAPSNSSASLWDTKCASGGLMKTSNYLVPEGKPSESRASPPPVQGTGRLSAIAERGQPLRDSSNNSAHGKML